MFDLGIGRLVSGKQRDSYWEKEVTGGRICRWMVLVACKGGTGHFGTRDGSMQRHLPRRRHHLIIAHAEVGLLWTAIEEGTLKTHRRCSAFNQF